MRGWSLVALIDHCSVYGDAGEPGEPLYGYTDTPFTPVCLHVSPMAEVRMPIVLVQVPKGPPHRAKKVQSNLVMCQNLPRLAHRAQDGGQSAVSRQIWPEKGPKGPFWGQICPVFSSHTATEGLTWVNMGQTGYTWVQVAQNGINMG